jgi:hypothetical protein
MQFLPAVDFTQLVEGERFQLLAEAGIPMTACPPARDAEEAERAASRIGLAVVLKGTPRCHRRLLALRKRHGREHRRHRD